MESFDAKSIRQTEERHPICWIKTGSEDDIWIHNYSKETHSGLSEAFVFSASVNVFVRGQFTPTFFPE